ncbi:uncharacterized protein [Pyrus communis]|uniref:uncharacterized protein n=1 Tax=Pyrus communis TaxID=23211 RepID=UPI0035C01F7F
MKQLQLVMCFLENIRDGHQTAVLFQKTPKENNLLHIAAEFKQINFKEGKINHKSPWIWATNKNGETPLHVAARVGCDEVVTFLIDSTKLRPIEGVDPEKKPIDGQAYKKLLANESPSFLAVRAGSIRIADKLGMSALYVAGYAGHTQIVEELIRCCPES